MAMSVTIDMSSLTMWGILRGRLNKENAMKITRNHNGDILIVDKKGKCHLLHEMEDYAKMLPLLLYQCIWRMPQEKLERIFGNICEEMKRSNGGSDG